MPDYAEKLRDPRWQKRRLEIMERDGWRCQECGTDKATLHVHHICYGPLPDPWDSAADYLVTLCVDCHTREPRKLAEAMDWLASAIRTSGGMARHVAELANILNDCEFDHPTRVARFDALLTKLGL